MEVTTVGLECLTGDVAKPVGSDPVGEEMGRRPPACGRRRDVRMSAVVVEAPGSTGQVYDTAIRKASPDP